MDDGLDLVRRGFDPAQVQQLVGQLAAELRALATENDRLRAALAERGTAPSPTTPAPEGFSAGSVTVSGTPPAENRRGGNPAEKPGDVFDHWSEETEALMAAARRSIAAVTERATAQAAAAIAAGETAGQAIRQRAQLDADAIVADARRRAERAGEVAAAEQAARAAEARAAAERAHADLVAARAELEELRARRAAVSRQLGNARTLLQQVLELVEADEDHGTGAGAPTADPSSGADSAEGTLDGAASADDQH